MKTFQGNPCKRGHSGQRYASNKWCVDCAKEKYAENLEYHKAKARRWADKNPERRRQLNRQWVEKNPEKRKEAYTRWVRENLAQVRALGAKRRAAVRRALCELTPEECQQIERLYEEAERLTKQTGQKWHVDHDKPLARGGVHHPSNLCVILASVNQAKGARFDSTLDYLLS